MILKLVYILFFAASNLVIYALIHKKGLIKRNLLITFIAIYTVVFLLHAILGNNGILLSAHSFFISTIFLAIPVIVYLWFNFLALKRINRLKEKGVNFENISKKKLTLADLYGILSLGVLNEYQKKEKKVGFLF